jgi:hypothetical protein
MGTRELNRPQRKEGNVSKRSFVFGVVAGLVLCASAASAQSASPQASTENWQFELVPYLWGSAIDGEVGIGNRTANIDASFSNIVEHLHFAAMGLAEARRKNLVVLSDALYTDLRGQRATPGPLFSSVRPEQKLFILTPEAGYRVVNTDNASIDALGGIRYWHLKSELDFRAGVLPSIEMEASRNWVDAIVGVRARRALPRDSWVSAYGDVGAGGSDLTYQLVGTVGMDIGARYALTFAYRYLKVDYDKDRVLLDTAMQGPLFGFTFKF